MFSEDIFLFSEKKNIRFEQMKSDRICILTQPLWNNYGALLQAYALQRRLLMAGYDAVTDLHPRRFLSFWQRSADRGKRLVSHYILRNLTVETSPYYPTRKDWEMIGENTARFVRDNIRTVDFFEGGEYPPASTVEKYDTFVVGSDQVWRDSYSRVESYFCDFAFGTDKKRVAYAASFGLAEWQFDARRTQRLKELAGGFEAISVREKDAVELCRRWLGADAVHVCDPTLLLSRGDYEALVHKADTAPSAGNMMCYILDRSEEKALMCRQMAERLSLKPFEVMPERLLDSRNRHCDASCVFPKVEQWLRGFMDADFVFTDSFHGMVFAIIFHKPFAVVANASRGLSRFESLTSLLGLGDRLVSEKERSRLPEMDRDVDFDRVEERLCGFRTVSEEFLFSALEGEI